MRETDWYLRPSFRANSPSGIVPSNSFSAAVHFLTMPLRALDADHSSK